VLSLLLLILTTHLLLMLMLLLVLIVVRLLLRVCRFNLQGVLIGQVVGWPFLLPLNIDEHVKRARLHVAHGRAACVDQFAAF
jgi:hypothetical protein